LEIRSVEILIDNLIPECEDKAMISSQLSAFSDQEKNLCFCICWQLKA